jgi:hypothetical protein
LPGFCFGGRILFGVDQCDQHAERITMRTGMPHVILHKATS